MSGCLSKSNSYTRYVSADTAARQEDIERQIKDSSEDIEENNEIVRGSKGLAVENRLDQFVTLEHMRTSGVHNYTVQHLYKTFITREEDTRCKELGDVIFYYLLKDGKPIRNVQYLINILNDDQHTESDSWYEVCCYMLVGHTLFTQFYKRLGNNPSSLEYLIYKQPQLLFNKHSDRLIGRLIEHILYDNLQQILLNTRDENGQTFMFYTRVADDLYVNRSDDLYELLSVCNTYGQTALHVNSGWAFNILFANVTLHNQDKMIDLLSIRDNYNQTVYDLASVDERPTWLKYQHENSNYPLYHSPTILILYKANKDRSGAEEEAEQKSIYQAFSSVAYSYHIEMQRLGTTREVLQLIKEAAADWRTSALIVCVMSHGGVGTIEDSEGKFITLTSIERAMCSNELKDRPKILITQSCGTKRDRRDYPQSGVASSSSDAGPSSGRDVRSGSTRFSPVNDNFCAVQLRLSDERPGQHNTFILYLAEQIKNSSKWDSFEDLVKQTSRKMMEEGNRQTPTIQSTLRGRICLKDHWNTEHARTM